MTSEPASRRGLPRPAPASPPASAVPGGSAAPTSPAPFEAASVSRFGVLRPAQWLLVAALVVVALIALVGVAVLAAWWAVAQPAVHDFLVAFPGSYRLPTTAPVGIPVWLEWQHFLNALFILLIIRSGLIIRAENGPVVYWTIRWPRQAPRKISLTSWFHQSFDILWITNGAVYLVLLFATGQWVRIVPTSWAVLPDALSAGLQYLSLDWPTEDGWVNFNALQQLAYFATVFVAAPLAIATGVRMSGIWPRNARVLNRIYPIEWARRIHFPVMIYFVLFVIAHVALVFATGMLRNLNHMYGGQDAVNWTGFGIFAGTLVVMVAVVVLVRPSTLRPVAALLGRLSRS